MIKKIKRYFRLLAWRRNIRTGDQVTYKGDICRVYSVGNRIGIYGIESGYQVVKRNKLNPLTNYYVEHAL